jgi:hypothetical protein
MFKNSKISPLHKNKIIKFVEIISNSNLDV